MPFPSQSRPLPVLFRNPINDFDFESEICVDGCLACVIVIFYGNCIASCIVMYLCTETSSEFYLQWIFRTNIGNLQRKQLYYDIYIYIYIYIHMNYIQSYIYIYIYTVWIWNLCAWLFSIGYCNIFLIIILRWIWCLYALTV